MVDYDVCNRIKYVAFCGFISMEISIQRWFDLLMSNICSFAVILILIR